MPICIHTRYLGATDKRQARVKAMCWRDSRVTFSVTVNYAWDGRDHEAAAEALRDKHWPGATLEHVGSTLDGRGDVFAVRLPA